jgi:hypothetical protein
LKVGCWSCCFLGKALVIEAEMTVTVTQQVPSTNTN